MTRKWICSNCNEENSNYYDICSKCNYDFYGKPSNKERKKKYIIFKYRKGTEDEPRLKKIILTMLFIVFMGFLSGILNKIFQGNEMHSLKEVKYNLQDPNESKTIFINVKKKEVDIKEKIHYLALGFRSPNSEFSRGSFLGNYKLDILDKNNNVLKSINIYNQEYALSKEIEVFQYYIFYTIEIPFQKKFYELNIKLRTIEVPVEFHKITSKTYFSLRDGDYVRFKDRDKELKEYGKNIIGEEDNISLIPLYNALKSNNFNKIKKILKDNINISMKYNRKPIHLASYFNDVKTLKYLLNRGADIYQKDIFGNTPTKYAINHNSLDSLKFLLSKGVDIKNILNLNGEKPRFSDELFSRLTSDCNYDLSKIILNSITIEPYYLNELYDNYGRNILDNIIARKCRGQSYLQNITKEDTLKLMIKLYREFGAKTTEELNKR